MVESAVKRNPFEAQALFAPNFAEVQERNMDMFSRANDVLTKAARPIWENQTEVLRLEAEQAAKAFAPPRFGADPSAAVSDYCDLWRENSEKLVAHMRAINDLSRDCGWQLLQIYTTALQRNVTPIQVQSR